VATIIALLAALVVGLAGYAQRKEGVSRARATMAMLATACESFKAENSVYPTSEVVRVSITRWAEAYNTSLLWAELRNRGYLNLSSGIWQQVLFNSCGGDTNLLETLIDPWGSPYSYYCTYPRRPTESTRQAMCYGYWGTNAHLAVGGQVNTTSFDLYSYGPDRATYCKALAAVGGYGMHVKDYAIDDIWN